MCNHEWTVHQLSKSYVWIECDKCHDGVTLTDESMSYDFGDEHGDTGVWAKFFETIKQNYAFGAVLEERVNGR